MRRFALPLALIVGLLVSGATAAGSETAFQGEWIGNDPAPPDGDGSVVHLYINGGTHAAITFTDEYGTICEHVGSPVTFFRSALTGEVDGDSLTATFKSAHCGSVLVKFLKGETMELELDDQGNADPSDDTLSDGSVTWQRVN